MASAETGESAAEPDVTKTARAVEIGAVGTNEPNQRNSNGGGSSGAPKPDKEQINTELGKLETNIKSVEDIPAILRNAPLTCLKDETKQSMMFFLDPESDVMTDDGKCKDYRGVAEWANLDTAFCKYISDIGLKNKINDVLSMWIKGSDERRIPDPTIGNLRQCLIDIERPDALSTLAPKIARDAIAWQKTCLEARTEQSQMQDTSWQLTRHDVLNGKETFYTACLMFADEDYRMAQIILNLYKKVKKDSLFFVPQFDLKFGKYEKDTTARIISERCGHKVIFLLSQYFLASKLCEFTTNYAAQNGTNNGNIIPFHLTRDVDHVPNVLRGIVGIRWFRDITRTHSWEMLTEGLFNTGKEDEKSKSNLEDLKREVKKVVDEKRDYYLADPPYDSDTPAAGEPIQFDEPEGISGHSSMLSDSLMACPSDKKTKVKFKMLQAVKKIIVEKVLGLNAHKGEKTSSKYSDKHGCYSTTRDNKTSEHKCQLGSSGQDSCASTKASNSRVNITSTISTTSSACEKSEQSNSDEMVELVARGAACGANEEEQTETDRLLETQDESLNDKDRNDSEEDNSLATAFHSANSTVAVETNEETVDVVDKVAETENVAENISITTNEGSSTHGNKAKQHSYVV